MFTTNLFNEILVQPVKDGANKLHIVSGYATPAIAYKQLQTVRDQLKASLKISLIIGMIPIDGLLRSYHQQFCELANYQGGNAFECRYLVKRPPVHSKVYIWGADDVLRKSYTGSANYTNTGFFIQREALCEDVAEQCYEYYLSLLDQTINCLDPDVENKINLTDKQLRIARQISEDQIAIKPAKNLPPGYLAGHPIKIDFLDKNGDLPSRSGLNWGQRPELRRNPNQAYIRVPAQIADSRFFPSRRQHFTIITDDGKTLDAVIAQDRNKAIETTFDNSLLGLYFRERLGLSSGALVTKEDLERYGRTDVDFVKMDDETYFMNFSVRRG